MPIEINGTGSIVGVDSLSTPAVTNAAGSASAPSITFTGDSNTGIYSPAADTIAFTEGGVESVRIDSSGRVGIGTTSAQTRLHVKSGAANFTGGLFLEASASDNGTYLWHDGTKTVLGSSYVSSGSYTPLTFQTSDSERARIDTSGRLLVGTSSTSGVAKLQVQGYVGDNTGVGLVELQAGSATPTSGTGLGRIDFSDNASRRGAVIAAERDGGTWSASSQPGRLVFSTTVDGASSPTERMRINNSGGVLINTTTHRDSARLVVDGDGSSVNSVWYAPSTSSYSVLYFRNPNGNTGRIDLSGTTTSYVTTSDYRLKENIEPVTNGIARLQQLKPSRFNFIVDPDKTVDGFIAHEVQEVVPEAISGEKDAVDADGNPVYQGIDQSKLVPLLTAALQEAIGEIESLKARVAALESA